jgi:hypothetical protein
MLKPMRTVEMEETPGAGRFVERAVGERNEMRVPGTDVEIGGVSPVLEP